MKTAAQGLPQTEDQDDNRQEAPAELNLRIKALESLLVEKGFVDPAGLDALIEAYKNKIGPRNGERAVAQPRVYSADKQRLSYFKAAAVHAAPVYLNRQATLNKACDFIHEAARKGAEFIAFPESFLPGFPIWAALWAPIENHAFFREMVANSILVDGEEIQRLQQASRTEGVFVSMGFSERNPASVGGMWNSNVLISDEEFS